MTSTSGTSGVVKIVAGIAAFGLASLIQATLGDSNMFSMSYVDQGFVQGLLVNLTFWPGWLATVVLIGAGVMELADGDTADAAETKPWDAE